jgi:hypothetical protein
MWEEERGGIVTRCMMIAGKVPADGRRYSEKDVFVLNYWYICT